MKKEKSKTSRLVANLLAWRRHGYQPPACPKLAKAIRGELLIGGRHDDRVLLEIIDCLNICREALPRAFNRDELRFYLRYAALPVEQEIPAIMTEWGVGKDRAFKIRIQIIGDWEIRLWRAMAEVVAARGGKLCYHRWARLCNGYLYPEARPAVSSEDFSHAV